MFKQLFAILFIGLSVSCYSQDNPPNVQHLKPIPTTTFYSNGMIKEKGEIVKGDKNVYWKHGAWVRYFKNGELKDSAFYNNKLTVGTAIRNYQNGRLKTKVTYADKSPDMNEYTIERYTKKGILKSKGKFYKKTKTSFIQFYNQKGKVIRQVEENKNKYLKVQYGYRNQRHLKVTPFIDSLQFDRLRISKDNKNKVIKKGALVSLKLRGDSIRLDHIQIEGFSNNSVYCSDFSYDLSESRKTLKLDSVFSIPLKQVETIFFSMHHKNLNEYAAFTLYLTGKVILIEPLIFFPLMGKPFLIISPVGTAILLTGALINELAVCIHANSFLKNTILTRKAEIK